MKASKLAIVISFVEFLLFTLGVYCVMLVDDIGVKFLGLWLMINWSLKQFK